MPPGFHMDLPCTDKLHRAFLFCLVLTMIVFATLTLYNESNV